MDLPLTQPFTPFHLFIRADENTTKPFNASQYEGITCPRPIPALVGTGLPVIGSLNFHQFMFFVSAGCLGLTLMSCMLQTFRHLHRYTSPQEQRQILRVVNLPLSYCLFNFLAVTFTLDNIYIQPLADVYEAFAVAALFFLVLEYVAPDGTDREAFFSNLENRGKKGEITPGGSLEWYRTTYATVLQYPLLKTLLIIVQLITQYFGDYCIGSFSPHHAHLYLFLADLLFVGGALGACINFSKRFKGTWDPTHRVPAKIWTFLGIIFFQIIQDILFGLLNGKVFSPSRQVTYNDINFGIASFLTCVEAVIFSALMWWAFSATEYKEGVRKDRLGMGPAQRVGTFRAIGNALNMSDIVAGTVVAMKMLVQKYANKGRGGGGRGGSGDMHLEPLAGYGGGESQGVYQQGGHEGETRYAAGYHAPPGPPETAYESLRPNRYGREESYGYERRRSEEIGEGEPLQNARSMV